MKIIRIIEGYDFIENIYKDSKGLIYGEVKPKIFIPNNRIVLTDGSTRAIKLK